MRDTDTRHTEPIPTPLEHFLGDARSNLDAAWQIEEHDHVLYQQLLRHYRQVATLLECREAFEALVEHEAQRREHGDL
jgi:hypothetical protein